MQNKVGRIIALIGLALSIVFIIWITLFSRIGSNSRYFYPPFWSYKAIANGSIEALYEVLGNIILFLPIGVMASLILHLNLWQTIVAGLSLSLLVEFCQWFFWLGAFEIDDLIHNTIGAMFGGLLAIKACPFKERKKSVLILGILIASTIFISYCYQEFKIFTMTRYAAMNDREDGKKNLLVLYPNPKCIGQTGFRLLYNADGSVLIFGKTKELAWLEIGRISLPAGRYSFSGLSYVIEKTVALNLEYYNEEQGKYLQLTQDVGPVNKEIFNLEETTKIRALIKIYAGAEGEFLARPVIYEED